MSGLSQEDRAALYADELRFDNLQSQWARNSLELDVEAIVARHVKAALTEAAELMSRLLHNPDCDQCDDVRECIAIIHDLADPAP